MASYRVEVTDEFDQQRDRNDSLISELSVSESGSRTPPGPDTPPSRVTHSKVRRSSLSQVSEVGPMESSALAQPRRERPRSSTQVFSAPPLLRAETRPITRREIEEFEGMRATVRRLQVRHTRTWTRTKQPVAFELRLPTQFVTTEVLERSVHCALRRCVARCALCGAFCVPPRDTLPPDSRVAQLALDNSAQVKLSRKASTLNRKDTNFQVQRTLMMPTCDVMDV